MSHFLCTKEYPDGHKLEDLLLVLRNDLILRMSRIASDRRPEAKHVLYNDIQILDHLSRSIELAEESSKTLLKAFGPTKAGQPRIGATNKKEK